MDFLFYLFHVNKNLKRNQFRLIMKLLTCGYYKEIIFEFILNRTNKPSKFNILGNENCMTNGYNVLHIDKLIAYIFPLLFVFLYILFIASIIPSSCQFFPYLVTPFHVNTTLQIYTIYMKNIQDRIQQIFAERDCKMYCDKKENVA